VRSENPDVQRVRNTLQRVNLAVNTVLTYQNDHPHYGDDKWVQYPTDWRGDCDDYALTKMDLLRKRGVSILDMRLIQLKVDQGKEQGLHAVLLVRIKDDPITWVLDNRYDEIVDRAWLEKNGYTFGF
jgi:predicted transglutaminase-like cysteine proteinase